ncbi:MAG: nuclear transport factor 2 family protein [Cyanobacteria bacterium P01_G01_bin.19]
MNNIAIAKIAFNYFSQGLASGEWADFIAMLTEDFNFSFPVAPFQGNNIGKDKAKKFFNYVSQQVFATGLNLTVERITSNENTVVFEVRSQGLMFGKPYNNQAAISFDVKGDRICGYREYLSVIYQPDVQNN